MRIIRRPEENPIEMTCAECNTLFSFTLPEVSIITTEEDCETANYHRTGFLKGEWRVAVYRKKKAVIYCPHCNKKIRVRGYMEGALWPEKIGERVLTKQEVKDWKYPIY
jgi:hypothetical protein